MTHAHETLEELREPGRELRRRIPEVYSAFATLDRVAMGEGELETKYKELIALAIGATVGCEACLAAAWTRRGAGGRDRPGGRRGDGRRDPHERRPRHHLGTVGTRGVPRVRGRRRLTGSARRPAVATDEGPRFDERRPSGVP